MVKRILIATEKHDTWHFDATTNAQLGAAALYLVKERFGQNGTYAGWEPDDSPPQPPELGLTEAQLEALPDDSPVKIAGQQAVSNCERATAAWKRDIAQADAIKQCIAAGDGRMAWQVLCSRRDYEYEHVELRDLDVVPAAAEAADAAAVA